MGTLTIKLTITHGTFNAVEYRLEGVDPTGHADVYYNFGDLIGNLGAVQGSSAQESLKLYCIRKIDFSTMVVNDATKNFQTNRSKGTITYHQNPAQAIITPAPSSLRCIGLNRVCLLNGKERLNQPSRKKLPHYLLASDIQQFNENVQFDGVWDDRKNIRLVALQNRWCCFTLNLFENE
jgi:hypothetical protein